MRQYSAIAAFACGKGTQKLQNPIAKIDRQREDRAQLNDDRVHLPEAIVQIDAQYRFADAQVRGGTHRQKFSQSLDDSEKDRQGKVMHRLSGWSGDVLKRLSRYKCERCALTAPPFRDRPFECAPPPPLRPQRFFHHRSSLSWLPAKLLQRRVVRVHLE